MRRFHWRVGAVALVSLAWRMAYVSHWKGHDEDLSDEGDAFYYSAQAVENASGHLFRHPFRGGPAADHPPLTALLITPVSWLDDRVVLAQRGVMVLVGTTAVVVIALVAREVAGDRAGIVAAVLAGAYAPLWMNDGLVMAEAPAALLVALLLLLAIRLYDEITTGRMLAFGVVAGLAVLTRAELGLLFPLVLVPPLVRAADVAPRLRWQGAGWAAVGAMVVAAPWVGWNLARFEEPTLVSTNDGLTIVGANCPSTYHGRAVGFWDLQCALDHPVAGDASVESAEWRGDGIAYARDNMGRLPAVAAARIGRMWGVYEPAQMVSLNTGEGRERWASWLGMYQSWVAMPIALAGAVVLHRRHRPVAPFVATAITVTTVALLFYGIVRFRVPADVSTAVLVAVAADAALPGGRGRPTGAGSSRPDGGAAW